MTFPISRYLNVRQAHFPSFSANGQRLVFLTDITGIPELWQVDLSHGLEVAPWPDRLTFTNDRVMGAWFSPAAGDGRLVYAGDVGGNENAQLFLLSADGAEHQPLTAGHEDAMHIFGAWSPDGSQILFAANRRDPGLFDLYLQSLERPEQPARLVWQQEEAGYLFDITFSPDGRRAAVRRAISSFESELYEVDLESGEVRRLSPTGGPVRYEQPQYAPDGQSLFTLTDLDSDFLYVARLDLADGEWQTVVEASWDCEALALSPDGRYLAYAVNVDGVSELRLLERSTGESWTAPLESAGIVGMFDGGRLSFSTRSDRLAFSFTGATRTSDIFVWDLAAGQVRPVTRSSHGGLPRDRFVEPALIRYPTFDDREIPAWLYRPAAPADGPLPVVVIVHGGPESQSRPYFHFFIHYLLHNGYAVFVPNVRGSTGYGKHYSHLDDVEKRMDSVADLAYAARWLRDQPAFDGRRLAVYGGSYGGFMVLATLTTNPELWAAGVNIVGISNFVTFLENTSAYRRAHREAEYGSLDRDRAFLEGISPLNHVDQITAPLMVIHGANDPRVPLSEAEQLVSKLEARGVPVNFLVFDDEGHGLIKLHNKMIAYPAVVDFLDTHLANGTDG